MLLYYYYIIILLLHNSSIILLVITAIGNLYIKLLQYSSLYCQAFFMFIQHNNFFILSMFEYIIFLLYIFHISILKKNCSDIIRNMCKYLEEEILF